MVIRDRLRLMQIVDNPRKSADELRRIVTLPWAWLYFYVNGVSWGRGWRIYGLPLIQRRGGSSIEIGNHLQMRNWLGSNPLAPNHRTVLATRSTGARIVIGRHVGMTGATIVSESEIIIGNRVRIGANSTIVDTDFHPLTVVQRRRHPLAGQTSPVIIEDDVFIGMSAIILKGARIGRGSVLGAGSVVAGEVPPGVIVAGNPAVIVRQLDQEEGDAGDGA